MNAKKLGLVGAGVLTALLAVSPMAFATDGHHEPSTPNKACAFQGGDAAAASEISGDSLLLGNAVTQAPVGGNNAGNAGNCSEFLNDNGNGNGSNNSVEVLSPVDEAPVDSFPGSGGPVGPLPVEGPQD